MKIYNLEIAELEIFNLRKRVYEEIDRKYNKKNFHEERALLTNIVKKQYKDTGTVVPLLLKWACLEFPYITDDLDINILGKKNLMIYMKAHPYQISSIVYTHFNLNKIKYFDEEILLLAYDLSPHFINRMNLSFEYQKAILEHVNYDIKELILYKKFNYFYHILFNKDKDIYNSIILFNKNIYDYSYYLSNIDAFLKLPYEIKSYLINDLNNDIKFDKTDKRFKIINMEIKLQGGNN